MAAPHGIRRLRRVSKRDAPSPFQRPTSMGPVRTLPHARTKAAPKCISGRTSYLGVRLAFHLYPQVIPALCNGPGFGPPRACSPRFSLPMGSSPRFGSLPGHWPPFRTRFRSGSACRSLSLATNKHSSAHSTKGTPSPSSLRSPSRGIRLPGSDRPEARGFRLYFTPLDGVLFTVPSRYWFTIGRRRYLALGRGRPRFPPDVACPAVLTQPDHPRPSIVAYGTLTPSGHPFQRCSADACPPRRVGCRHLHRARPTPASHRRQPLPRSRFGLLPVRSPLLGESSLFLPVLRCFSSRTCLPRVSQRV